MTDQPPPVSAEQERQREASYARAEYWRDRAYELEAELQAAQETFGKMQALGDRWGDDLEGPEVLEGILGLLPAQRTEEPRKKQNDPEISTGNGPAEFQRTEEATGFNDSSTGARQETWSASPQRTEEEE